MSEAKGVTETVAVSREVPPQAGLATIDADRSWRPAPLGEGGDAGASGRGHTSIADAVVAKIAGLAVREIEGVHALGGSVGRVLDAVRQRVPGGRPNVAHGVSVEVGERQCAVDVNVVVEYGVAIAHLGAAIREHVIATVERMTGLEVVEVNVAVDDIHLPDHDPQPHGRVA